MSGPEKLAIFAFRAMSCARVVTLLAAVSLVAPAAARADTIDGSYEGGVSPLDDGFEVFQECDPPFCATSVTSDHFVVTWSDQGDFFRYANIFIQEGEPSPPTFWAEWRYRSNNPNPLNSLGCDAFGSVQFLGFADGVELWGDSAQPFDAGSRILGLDLNDFHTARVEMRADFDTNMIERRFWIDGQHLSDWTKPIQNTTLALVSFGGGGGCFLGEIERPNPVINEWDFVRWGTLTEGEKLVAVSPRGGLLPQSDRFSVTFDQPHYAFVDEITVESTEPVAPVVTRTWRIDGQDSNAFEIGLDRAIEVGETIIVTIGDPADGNIVTLTGTEAGVPATSTWGVAALALALCTAATILVRLRHR